MLGAWERMGGRTALDAVEQLLAIEEIKRLKARYFRSLDTRDWAELAAVFSADVVVDLADGMVTRSEPDRVLRPFGEMVCRGREAVTAMIRESLEFMLTIHHGHMPEIEVTSPTTATGVWAMEDLLRPTKEFVIRSVHGFGHYHETYDRSAGCWQISSMLLTRLRLDVEFSG
jgi:hypothetical protein